MTVVIDGTTGIDTVQDGTVAPADLTTGAPSWNSAGNLSFNSGYGSVATAYGCRAWVNFNGTGTVAIRADGGVSSITDNNVGDYTVNFDVAMTDANYGISLGVKNGNSRGGSLQIAGTPTASAVQVINREYTGSSFQNTDEAYVCVAIFR